MAVPPTAGRFSGSLDPSEELDFEIRFSSLLESGEKVARFTLALLPEAVAMGLMIMAGEGRDLRLIDEGEAISFWLTVDPQYRENVEFTGGGIPIPMELTIVTTSLPPRTRQRTLLVSVVQQ